MLRRVEISRFRCFNDFSVSDLRPINLIVGKNNAGKTCLLEGLDLLASGSPTALGAALVARGEEILLERADRRLAIVPDVRCAFFERSANIGAEFSLKSMNDRHTSTRELRVRRVEGRDFADEDSSALEQSIESRPPIAGAVEGLEWSLRVGDREDVSHVVVLPNGGMASPLRRDLPDPIPARFIHTALGDPDSIARLWGPIAATEYEEKVVGLLRIVEPGIERIAAAPGPRGGIFVRLRGTKERVPLGSFGDGTTRLFSLACNLISVQGGLLLIDEIDTGLHVSTMLEMWAFLFHAVKEFDVQVFATTHSDDCIRGLTEFLRCDEDARGKARLFRMERGASTMTSYDSEEIVSTSDAGIEVR